MKITLSLYHCATKLRDYVLDAFPIVIGRSEDADISICDRWVSRRHCELSVQEGQLVLRDLGSKHGTRMNNSPVSEAVVAPGESFSVGLSTFVARYGHSPDPPADDSASTSTASVIASAAPR